MGEIDYRLGLNPAVGLSPLSELTGLENNE